MNYTDYRYQNTPEGPRIMVYWGGLADGHAPRELWHQVVHSEGRTVFVRSDGWEKAYTGYHTIVPYPEIEDRGLLELLPPTIVGQWAVFHSPSVHEDQQTVQAIEALGHLYPSATYLVFQRDPVDGEEEYQVSVHHNRFSSGPEERLAIEASGSRDYMTFTQQHSVLEPSSGDIWAKRHNASN